MAPVIPNPANIREFADAEAFAAWMAANAGTADELWLKAHKKGSGLKSVPLADALDICLCWGWIDGIRKSLDETSFLQRYTPRRSKSIWSQVNRDHIARLTAAGLMQPAGLAQVDLAKADGRWDAAYAPVSKQETPEDLMAAIAAEPEALALYKTLTSQNRFALTFRTTGMKTVAGRQKKIASLVDMLKRGETPYPQGKARK